MYIKTVKEINNQYSVNNGEHFVPKDDAANRHYQKIQKWIDDGGVVEQEDLLKKAKDAKKQEAELYLEKEKARAIQVRSAPDYYLKPSPEVNIFLAGYAMEDGESKEWRAFDANCNKLNNEDGTPLTLMLTKSELIGAAKHYENRKTGEYNSRDLKIIAIDSLTTIEEVEAFDVTEPIV